MYTFVIVIHIIACFILIASILLQSGRGGGLAGLFGGGTSQTIFGARASTFLTRTTTVAAVAFLLTCISLTVFSSRRVKSLMSSVKETEVAEQALPESTTQGITVKTQQEEAKEIQREKPEASEAAPKEVEQSTD